MAQETREWVETRRADLAKRAWMFVEDNQIKAALSALEPTALRTLLGAAANATCLLEVFILLRYQQGRDREKWKEVLVTGIVNQLTAAAETAAASKHLKDAQEVDTAEAMLATSWLGFLVRLHRYHYEMAREQRLREPRGR